MKLIDQSFMIEDLGAESGLEILKKIERAGRTCYKSEEKITDDSAEKFVRGLIKSGHHSVIEHHSVTARIVSNRGVTHELVRHRLAAYSQESTRYCNYGGREMAFIRPVWLNLSGGPGYPETKLFLMALQQSEDSYNEMLKLGWSPQQAREVLPNALKTEIVMTANLREWRHVFKLRCDRAAHPQIRALMLEGLSKMAEAVPAVFDDLAEEYNVCAQLV